MRRAIDGPAPLPVLAVALAACLLAGDAFAQCLGSARPLTANSGSTGCTLNGARPYLSWSFRIDCVDDCGNQFTSLPTVSETANGSCAISPAVTCMPFFDQFNHTNGLYGVTSAREQYLFGGCQISNTVKFTDGSCPCSPICTNNDDDTPTPVFQQPGYGSPILVSLRDGRYELTSVDDGVVFDIDGNGTLERVAWTAAGADEAFLALDRDGNGSIDHGRELFGDGSPQTPSDERHGFRALALFDEPQNGGDGDGWIGPGDAIFQYLLLWRDDDRDGASHPRELVQIGEAGLEGISLDVRTTRRRDRHGNQFRYSASTRWRSGAQRPAWDVFFVVAPVEP